MGYTRLAVPDPSDSDLPDAAHAHKHAFDFLARVDPNYAAELQLQWIDQHDETITTPDQADHTIAGMKVKTRHRDGRYAWAVVGPGPQIITYERDITWDAPAARRITHMWLHDTWIAAHDNDQPQPDPPYALTSN